MDKSEKSYYIIIENKKLGKFSGAGPIQVAKKVASKKLKSGKEIEFYLDEVGSKKKRYGPYQARKDKKTDKVVVVKGRKVMKGGLLTESNKKKLRDIFYNINDNLISPFGNRTSILSYIKTFKLPLISFFNEPIIFFDPSTTSNINYHYNYALFKEPNGYIYIIIYHKNPVLMNIVSFAEFFFNPIYLSIENRITIIDKLKENLKENEAKTIKQNLLLIELVVNNGNHTAIYLPDYSRPLIKKCVYPDLTFGILDEETPTRILSNSFKFPKPTNFFQKFLILKKTGLSGMSVNEPVIYVRNPFAINPIEAEELKQKIISEKHKYNSEILTNKNSNGKNLIQFEREFEQKLELLVFDYCIYYSSNDNKLIIIGSNYEEEFIINNDNLRNLNPIIFSILLGIPVEFGRFRRIREVSEPILKYHKIKRELPLQLSSIIKNIPKNVKQKQLETQIKQLQQIIESLKLLEPKEPEAQLNKVVRKLSIFPELKTQLNQIQSLINQLQPQQTLEKPHQNLEQQITLLQKVLTDKLIEKQKLQHFVNNAQLKQAFS